MAQERELCRRVLKRLNRAYAGRVELDGYFWEYEPMEITRDYQEQIPPPSSFDIFICILWSRLGSRLHSRYQLPDGRPCRSGTEFELVDAVEGRKKTADTPEILVWVNKTQPMIPLEPEKDYQQRIEQWRLLKAFLEEWTKCDDEGVFTGAVNSYRTLDRFEELLEVKLRKLVERRLGTASLPDDQRPPVQWTAGSPYRGLEAFGKEHADVFFGRTAAIESVLNAVRRQGDEGCGLVLLLGASGSGKSSLVCAGVLPFITTPGVIEGIGLWREASFRPGLHDDLMLGLANALLDQAALPELADPETNAPAAALASRLREVPKAAEESVRLVLNEAARAYQAEQERLLRERAQQLAQAGRQEDAEAISKRMGERKPPRARLVLVLDQMEELFTGQASEADKQALTEILGALASGGRVVILASLRSDFYHHFQETPGMLELTGSHGKVDVIPPDANEIGQIIREPARMAGLIFEKDAKTGGTLDEVLRDAALDHPEALPLLEHALDQLYACQAERGDHTLRFADYEAIGKLEGALARHADSVFDGLDAEAQGALDRVFRGLVTLGREDRIPVRRSAARALIETDAASKALVTAFVDQRLFTSGQTTQGAPMVSVAHEALLRVWDRARDWITANEDFLAVRARVSDACRQWLGADKDASFLLQPGRQLAEAEEALTNHQEAFSVDERRLIATSGTRLKETERRRRRLRQIILGAMTVLTLLAIAGFIHAQRQRREAEISAQREKNARQEVQSVSDASIRFMTELMDRTDWVTRLLNRDVQLAAEFSAASVEFMDELPQEGHLIELLDAWSRMQMTAASALAQQGKVQEAVVMQERGRDLLMKLDQADPDNTVIKANLANHDYVKGKLLQREGHIEEAMTSFQKGLTYIEPFLDRWSDDESLRGSWKGLQQSLADLERQYGDTERSRALFDTLIERLDGWAASGETAEYWWTEGVTAWVNRSEALIFVDDFEAAAGALEGAGRTLNLPAFNDSSTKPFLALRIERAWGYLESIRQNPAKAASHYRKWIEGMGPSASDEPAELLSNRLRVAKGFTSSLIHSQQTEEVLEAAQAALDLANRLLDIDESNTTNIEEYRQALALVAQAHQSMEAWEEAADFFRSAYEETVTLISMAPNGYAYVAAVDHALEESRCLANMERYPDALKAVEKALTNAQALGKILTERPGHPSARLWRRSLAFYHAQLGYGYSDREPEKAQEAMQAALDWSKESDLLEPYRNQWSQALEQWKARAE